jgi:hypothetical protein
MKRMSKLVGLCQPFILKNKWCTILILRVSSLEKRKNMRENITDSFSFRTLLFENEVINYFDEPPSQYINFLLIITSFIEW